RIVANREITPQMTEEDLVELLIGRTPSLQRAAPVASASIPLLEVSKLRTTNSHGISFQIGNGEIVGLYGVVGCGREEVGRALVGLHPVLGGTIKFCGNTYKARDPADALAAGIGFLSSDRKQEGILPNRSIRENLVLSSLWRMARGGVVQRQR